ncbi:IS110 family transposase [Bacillus sp. FJAT-26390]|uniref:IS110 family transposase n=1 Tax=Bacillus sp. FJAT-26390 TaxID=1743142 RepID=UPI0008081719|nr:IS110 family transposase [Bacillus sp. FJAT-26390]OBZ15754.1 transposase [Bacillus sp. FJAT-26390]
MNPVIGLDISKGKSDGQVFFDKGQPFGQSFCFQHNQEGLSQLLDVISNVRIKTEKTPTVILESTGHYHQAVIQFLEEHGILFLVVNPLISHQAKKSSLRKVKTDAVDAYRLCELYYKEEFEDHKQRGVQLLNLRHLTRQFDTLTQMYVQVKLQFQAILDQVFPDYRGIFGDLYSRVSLQLLKQFTTPTDFQAAGESNIAYTIASLCPSRSVRWADEKASLIVVAAANNPFQKVSYTSHLISLTLYIDLLLQYQEHLSHLRSQIDALAEEVEAYQIIQSIPGIGGKIAATILSEIGEIHRFNHAKKLVAFAGIDPIVYASGKFTATSNRITKRGSKKLRHALYLAVLCGLRKTGSKRLREFYDKKRESGKPYRVALIACVNKLLHWIYALLVKQEDFVDLA